jgi:hypothetical protein
MGELFLDCTSIELRLDDPSVQSPTHDTTAGSNLKGYALGCSEAAPLRAGVNYNDLVMAKTTSKSKSAMDTLIESVSRLRSEAKERMSKEEFRQAEEKFDEVVSRVRASRGLKRETA